MNLRPLFSGRKIKAYMGAFTVLVLGVSVFYVSSLIQKRSYKESAAAGSHVQLVSSPTNADFRVPYSNLIDVYANKDVLQTFNGGLILKEYQYGDVPYMSAHLGAFFAPPYASYDLSDFTKAFNTGMAIVDRNSSAFAYENYADQSKTQAYWSPAKMEVENTYTSNFGKELKVKGEKISLNDIRGFALKLTFTNSSSQTANYNALLVSTLPIMQVTNRWTWRYSNYGSDLGYRYDLKDILAEGVSNNYTVMRAINPSDSSKEAYILLGVKGSNMTWETWESSNISNAINYFRTNKVLRNSRNDQSGNQLGSSVAYSFSLPQLSPGASTDITLLGFVGGTRSEVVSLWNSYVGITDVASYTEQNVNQKISTIFTHRVPRLDTGDNKLDKTYNGAVIQYLLHRWNTFDPDWIASVNASAASLAYFLWTSGTEALYPMYDQEFWKTQLLELLKLDYSECRAMMPPSLGGIGLCDHSYAHSLTSLTRAIYEYASIGGGSSFLATQTGKYSKNVIDLIAMYINQIDARAGGASITVGSSVMPNDTQITNGSRVLADFGGDKDLYEITYNSCAIDDTWDGVVYLNNVGCNSSYPANFLASRIKMTMTGGGGADQTIAFYCPDYGSTGAWWKDSAGTTYPAEIVSCPLGVGKSRYTMDFGEPKYITRHYFNVGCHDGETMDVKIEWSADLPDSYTGKTPTPNVERYMAHKMISRLYGFLGNSTLQTKHNAWAENIKSAFNSKWDSTDSWFRYDSKYRGNELFFYQPIFNSIGYQNLRSLNDTEALMSQDRINSMVKNNLSKFEGQYGLFTTWKGTNNGLSNEYCKRTDWQGPGLYTGQIGLFLSDLLQAGFKEEAYRNFSKYSNYMYQVPVHSWMYDATKWQGQTNYYGAYEFESNSLAQTVIRGMMGLNPSLGSTAIDSLTWIRPRIPASLINKGPFIINDAYSQGHLWSLTARSTSYASGAKMRLYTTASYQSGLRTSHRFGLDAEETVEVIVNNLESGTYNIRYNDANSTPVATVDAQGDTIRFNVESGRRIIFINKGSSIPISITSTPTPVPLPETYPDGVCESGGWNNVPWVGISLSNWWGSAGTPPPTDDIEAYTTRMWKGNVQELVYSGGYVYKRLGSGRDVNTLRGKTWERIPLSEEWPDSSRPSYPGISDVQYGTYNGRFTEQVMNGSYSWQRVAATVGIYDFPSTFSRYSLSTVWSSIPGCTVYPTSETVYQKKIDNGLFYEAVGVGGDLYYRRGAGDGAEAVATQCFTKTTYQASWQDSLNMQNIPTLSPQIFVTQETADRKLRQVIIHNGNYYYADCGSAVGGGGDASQEPSCSNCFKGVCDGNCHSKEDMSCPDCVSNTPTPSWPTSTQIPTKSPTLVPTGTSIPTPTLGPVTSCNNCLKAVCDGKCHPQEDRTCPDCL